MVLNLHHSRLDLYWIQSGVHLTPEFLQCMVTKPSLWNFWLCIGACRFKSSTQICALSLKLSISPNYNSLRKIGSLQSMYRNSFRIDASCKICQLIACESFSIISSSYKAFRPNSSSTISKSSVSVPSDRFTFECKVHHISIMWINEN